MGHSLNFPLLLTGPHALARLRGCDFLAYPLYSPSFLISEVGQSQPPSPWNYISVKPRPIKLKHEVFHCAAQ